MVPAPVWLTKGKVGVNECAMMTPGAKKAHATGTWPSQQTGNTFLRK